MKILLYLLLIFFTMTGCTNKVLVSYQNNNRFIEDGLKDLKEKNYKDASMEFNRILSFDLENSQMQYLNALTYHLMAEAGDYSQYKYAEIGYKLSLKFDKNNWLASKQLSYLYFKLKKYILAQKYAINTLFYHPNDVDTLYLLASSSYYLYEKDLALCALKKAYKIDQKNLLVLRGLSLVYASLGKFDKSKDFLAQYAELTKADSDSSYIRERVKDWQHFSTLKFKNKPMLNTVDANTSNATDYSSKMVSIEIVIIGINQQFNKNIGINLLDGLNLQFGKTWTSSRELITDNTDISNSSNTNTNTITQNISIPDIKYSFNIFNHTLATYSIIAKPTLIALNGHQSEYFSGDTMHVGLMGTVTTDSSEIVDLPIGVKLLVTPNFLKDGTVQLNVDAQRTTLDETNTADGIINSIIWTSKKHVHANAVLKFGDTLMIAGLDEKEKEGDDSYVPFLNRMPILGYLFSKNATMDWSRSDMILLTPKKVSIEKSKKYNTNILTKEEIKFILQGRDILKTLYPNWKIGRYKTINNDFLIRQFRLNDMKYNDWSKTYTIPKQITN